MKIFTLIIATCFSLSALAQTGNAKTVVGKKSQTTTVSVNVHTNMETVWAMLTNAEDMVKWNSTVLIIKGEIKLGNTIELVSSLAPDKVFKLTVTEMVEGKSMVWSDGKGTREFKIEKSTQGITFTMTETIGGFMFKMWQKKLPDFTANFNQYALDLKNTAESRAHHH